MTIAHLGVTLFLLADLGADPFNVLIQGLFRVTGKIPGWPIQTHGNTHVAICFLIIVVLLIVTGVGANIVDEISRIPL